MIKKLKNKHNIILGIIVGFILSQIVVLEWNAYLAYRTGININTSYQELNSHTMELGKLIALIVFIVVVMIFNTKRMKKVNLNKLNIYIIFSVIFVIFLAIEIVLILSIIILPMVYSKSDNYFLFLNVGIGILAVAVIVAIGVFIFLINKKVKYITFLTKEVKKIKEEGFGKVIEIKGKDELAELCKSINEMSIELSEKRKNEKKIEKTKNELITNISHDLKTPLTSIIGYLELLNKTTTPEEEKNIYAKIAYNKSLRLKILVNELFEYTKLSSPDIKLEKVKFNISNLINQIVGESILEFEKKDIQVELDNKYREIFYEIDIKLFTRVFENLIENAIKYSDAHSIFKVDIVDNEEELELTFKNKCQDIKEEELNQIFEKFYRVDSSRNTEVEGSGLGLNIAKRIIELHKGNLTVKKEHDYIIFKVSMVKNISKS